MTKIAVVISSTRDSRFGDKPAQWIFDLANSRDDLDVELVDLRDYPLPMFNEMASNAWMPSSDPEAVRWQKKVAEFDGFIFVVAEYNHSITGALKNAIDQAYVEWVRKPAAYVGYGGVGAARAIEQLRMINVELQMVPVRSAVHIGGGELLKVHPMGANGPMSDIADVLAPSAKGMLDDLTWWAQTLKAPREKAAAAAAKAA